MFNLYPVYYIGITGEIYYYKNMTVTIKTNNTGSANPLFRGLLQDEILMTQKVDDYSMKDTYTSNPEPPENSTIINSADSYKYVIITNDSFINALPYPTDSREWFTFQDLADSKNENGTNTTIVTVSDIINDPINQNTTNPIFNDTQAKIRNFITRAYQLWGTEYVLIGGDNDIVPARYLWYWNHDNESDQYNDSLPSDLYYSCLDGSYNADNDSYWGEPQDGEFYTGDEYEPAGGGAFYVEADCEDLPSTIFNVGLFTPSLNLSNLPDPSNVSLDFECYFVSANLGDYINVSVYSGGKNE
ncbi:MAG: C25 family cysteine peptidase [Candidatus Thermoplasmatota archaeon]|nr:C25 family cysteine peptidase [Candidatus Thermoplasmatota archaeon]